MDRDKKIKKLIEEVENCKKCNLHKNRKNAITGEGSLSADVLFIGEAPGYWEDVKKRPFVGRSGKVLDKLIESAGLKREDVYITNILKCRPPENRNPKETEIKECSSYLDRQIAIIRPKVIATLGSFSTNHIFDKFCLKKERISDVHGKVFEANTIFGNIKIIPLYHPAVAVYNSVSIEELKKDFKSLNNI